MKENIKSIFALIAWLNFLAYCWYVVIVNDKLLAGTVVFFLVAVLASAVVTDSKNK